MFGIWYAAVLLSGRKWHFSSTTSLTSKPTLGDDDDDQGAWSPSLRCRSVMAPP
jgi:hypothetical protein